MRKSLENIGIFFATLSWGCMVFAQEETSLKPTLDDSPILSQRAAGLGGALNSLGDEFDGAFYNPATIGPALSKKADKDPFIRDVYMPYAATSTNKDSTLLSIDPLNSSQSLTEGKSAYIKEAAAGKPQYTRVSGMLGGVVIHRFCVLPYLDQQYAAVQAKDGVTDSASALFRSSTGILSGFAISGLNNRLALGASYQTATVQETSGDIAVDQLTDPLTAAKTFTAYEKTYALAAKHVGLTARLTEFGNIRFGLAARHLGGTTLSSADERITEDIGMGFAFSPRFKDFFQINGIIDTHHLTDPTRLITNKLRAGLEILLGSKQGRLALLGLRVGGSSAGTSAGASLNLGLISVEYGLESVDISTTPSVHSETRSGGAIVINAGAF